MYHGIVASSFIKLDQKILTSHSSWKPYKLDLSLISLNFVTQGESYYHFPILAKQKSPNQ
jgi:hypothetical protein